jgi:hypothetical protein
MREFEYTPEQMAEKLIEFNRDFSDDAELLAEEKVYVAELFDKLQKSEEFEILAHHLDLMFMDKVFSL